MIATKTKENAPANQATAIALASADICDSITKQVKQTPIERKANDIKNKTNRNRNIHKHIQTRRQRQVQLTITTVIQFAADFYPNHNKTEFA